MDCFATLAMTAANGVFTTLRHSGARSEPGISKFSGAQLRTLVRCFASPRNDSAKSRPTRIVRALARDRDVVDVAFAQARAGDADELGLVVEIGKVLGADIAHRRAQAAGELVHDVADRALVGHLALDALGH